MKKHLQGICLFLLVGLGYASAQDIKLTGKVKDQKGNALPGVNIVVSGTLQGTATDAVGDFTIGVAANGVLTFSFIGYKDQTVQVKNRSVIEVTLEEDLKNLNEVVVVGYGTQSKAKISDAISTIKMDNVLRDRPVSNLGAALEGTIPGMSVSIGSGQPGTKPSFNIRGYTSLNGGDPLFVVDNIPIDDISGLNPSDIETVSVLKDAASSVLYGARAAFGVILITTKKGKFNQPTSFEYAAGFSPTKVSTMPKKMNVREWVNVMESIGQTKWWIGHDIATYKSLLDQYEADPSQFPANGITNVGGINYSLRTYDQFADYFKGGQQQYHSFTASGGSDKLSFRSSVRFDNENGAIVGDNDKYKKWTTNNTITAQLNSKLNFSANVFYNSYNKTEPGDGFGYPFYAMVTQPSFTPTGYDSVMTENGMKYLPHETRNNMVQLQNPLIKYGDQLRLSSKLNFEPVKNLLLTGEYTYERTSESESRSNNNSLIEGMHAEYIVYFPRDPNAQSYTSYFKNNSQKNNQILNLFGKYSFVQWENHHLDLMVGTNQEYVTYETSGINRQGLLSIAAPSISTASGPITGGDGYYRYAVSGYFGQIQYDYQNKYILKLNARYDGSSRFPSGSRFGFFPSGSVAWNLMNENFMIPLEGTFNTLKLRASYGAIGNQVIRDNYYPAIPTMSAYNAGWLNTAANLPFITLSTPDLISSNLTWERVTTLGGGVDGTALRNRLNFSFDLFKRTTSGMIVPSKPLPAILGTGAPRGNAANMESKGFELSLGWNDQIGNVRYNISANLANDKAYITKYDNPSGTLNSNYVGQRMGELWGFVSDRLYQTSDFVDGSLNSNLTDGVLKSGLPYYEGTRVNPGDMMFVNLDGDNKVDSEGNPLITWGDYTVSNPGDRKIIGNESHQYRFGVTGGLDYKGFDFSFILNGIGKRQRDVNNAFFRPWQNQYFDILSESTDFWTKDNTDAHYARVYPQAGGNAWLGGFAQTRYMRSWAYLRVKNLALGYTLPESVAKRLTLKKIRLFVSGENLFTIDALPDGIDPGANDLSSGAMYPYLKKFNVGINVNF
jgi:TonB-linked SusC/RagA family outer membrane protein